MKKYYVGNKWWRDARTLFGAKYRIADGGQPLWTSRINLSQEESSHHDIIQSTEAKQRQVPRRLWLPEDVDSLSESECLCSEYLHMLPCGFGREMKMGDQYGGGVAATAFPHLSPGLVNVPGPVVVVTQRPRTAPFVLASTDPPGHVPLGNAEWAEWVKHSDGRATNACSWSRPEAAVYQATRCRFLTRAKPVQSRTAVCR
ncbi:hypothetical protein BKA56DRAFT_608121 [Ilyonectria sp. MPI-CAGE-AT-0026]|nr:hypothetical protein BKA56DRAFT_608121 [Ilyonectria sp. MPI-CAGE-AT-0026]